MSPKWGLSPKIATGETHSTPNESSPRRTNATQETNHISNITFAAATVVFSLYLLISALEFNGEARFLPITFGVPMLMLTVANLLREFLNYRRFRASTTKIRTQSINGIVESLIPFGWFVLMTVLVFLLGITIGGGAFLAALIYLHGRESKLKAVSSGAIFAGTYFLLVHYLLGARSFEGWLGVVS